MPKETFALLLFNLIYICALPFIFFRRDGTFNLKWMLTALPYVAGAAILVCGFLGILHPWFWTDASITLDWIAFVLATLSVVLISFTWGTNRVPLALWHQENDAPQNIVTYGAYRYIRHPFYTSFQLTMLASFLFFPHPLTLALFIYSIVVLTLTAKREEGRLSTSQFGSEYQAYMKRTGRFWPKV